VQYGAIREKEKIEKEFRRGKSWSIDLEWIFIMKCIWHKYKIWLLIGVFYTAYCVIKSFKILKHIDIHKIKLIANRS